MNETRAFPRIASLLVLTAVAAAGCLTSPAAKKQKFYEQGVRAFDQQRYPEAVISLTRALQVDPQFASAHYKLAQCHERQGNWTAAIQELNRTVR
jgi:tetratricopeptide (TPR) repeat protein